MTDRRRGIIDPWRVDLPLRAEPRESRVDIEDVDRDADLAIPGRQIVRSAYVSFEVTSTRVATPRDALDVLAVCIEEARRIKSIALALSAGGIGVRVGARTWNVPATGIPTSTLTGTIAVVFFANATLDLGMRDLARAFRLHEATPVCRKHGIVVMTNATKET